MPKEGRVRQRPPQRRQVSLLVPLSYFRLQVITSTAKFTTLVGIGQVYRFSFALAVHAHVHVHVHAYVATLFVLGVF